MADPDLLNIECGTITAPAGCGKTHLIAEALQRHERAKPILVLTHTNAGVAALRGRLDRFGVPRKNYRLATIDGWSMRVAGAYPNRSGVTDDVLKLSNPKNDYPAIRRGAVQLLEGHHINDILFASYDRLIVDEYQDCSVEQHALISGVADTLPCCVLGDPLQAIFGWVGNPDWNTEVLGRFPLAAELNIPWRWRIAGTEPFGQWLLTVRNSLLLGIPIDLREAPPEVDWVHLDGTEDFQRRIRAAHIPAPTKDGSVLIIADSKRRENHWGYASRIAGAVVVENADLGEFVDFAKGLDIKAPDAVEKVIGFAGMVMTSVGAAEMLKRIRTLQAERARRGPTDAEQAALNFANNPTPKAAVGLLVEINKQPGVRPHRPSILRACIKALNSCATGDEFYETAVCVREQNRQLGRNLPKRAVGSTLLLKGLEADVSVILETEQLKARDLYVAMTRGARKLVVCSSSPLLSPKL